MMAASRQLVCISTKARSSSSFLIRLKAPSRGKAAGFWSANLASQRLVWQSTLAS